MGLNDTPSGDRVHIGFFGRRNAGKSSVVNAVTNQELAIVSDTKGTTTDPVYKSMELLPMGPVMIIDTPGFDDVGELGEMRIKKTKQVLNKTDVAVLIVDAVTGLKACDDELLALFKAKEISYITVYNKADLLPTHPEPKENEIYVSALKKEGIFELKEMIAHLSSGDTEKYPICKDLIKPDDFVLLVIPIDKAAPKGRLILPEQQTIRDILDADAAAVVVKEFELKSVLENIGKKPSLVITDSQVFERVNKETPDDIRLTSFSILMARHKGYLDYAIDGIKAVEKLRDGDTVLIAEGCTHHRQCNDIGTVKIPAWLNEYTGKDIKIKTVSGTEYPDDLSEYAMVIHCGACMLNEREVRYRAKCTTDQGIPITNYGIFIAYTHGILKRGLSVFPDLQKKL